MLLLCFILLFAAQVVLPKEACQEAVQRDGRGRRCRCAAAGWLWAGADAAQRQPCRHRVCAQLGGAGVPIVVLNSGADRLFAVFTHDFL